MNARRSLCISLIVLAFLLFGVQAALALGSNVATLPQRWVNQHECDGTATVVKKVCHQGDSQCPFAPGDYDTTSAGLNQAISDAESLRLSSATGTAIRITTGADIKINGTAHSIVLRNFGYTGSRCVIFESSNPLPSRVRVGSVAISSISRDSISNIVKVVTSVPHLLTTSDEVEIKNVTGWKVNFNGDYPVSVVDARTFTYLQPGSTETGVVTPNLTVVTGPNTLAQQRSRNLYTLETTAINVPVIYTDPGAHHYVFYDGEIETTETTLGQAGPIVIFGPSVPATTFAGNAHHIGFDRMYVHGCAGLVPTSIPTWPEPVPCGSLDAGLKSGVRLNCSFCWIVNSFFDQMQMPGVESHALGTYDGQGPFKIVNNHLRGGATTLHFGNTPPTIPGLVPSDIEVRLNTIDLDPNWTFVSHACGGTTAIKWGLKSRLDFENVQRIVLEGNEFYRSWCDGDTGEMIYMGPSACHSINCTGGNHARMNDIYFANNLIAHSHKVFAIEGHGGGTGTTLPFQRMDVVNNLAWDIGVPLDPGRILEIAIGSRGQTYSCAAGRAAGVATLSGCACLQTNCPITGISAGHWLLTSNCSDPSFNATRTPALFSQPNTSGPVTYASPGPDVSGGVTCTLSNRQGWPRFLSFRHNTMVANLNSAGASFVNDPDGPISYYVRDFTLIDSISSNTPGTPATGWRCNGLPDGSRSSLAGRCWDVTSLSFHHFVAEGRGPTSSYSEYRNGIEVFPPTTVTFPSTNSCNGVYSSGCLGYAGDFATSNPPDYHDFALCHGPGIPSSNCTGRSVYAGAASDGRDMGVDLNQLDQARIKLRFSASSYPQ